MQIVININDKIYEAILDGWWPNNFVSIRQLIANGIPLPKGHGDLIDRSKLEVHYVGTDIGTDCPVYLLPTVEEASIIIAADKENE